MNELAWCVEHQFLLLVLVFSPYVNRVLGTGKTLIWDWGCSPVGRVPSVHEAPGSTPGTSYSRVWWDTAAIFRTWEVRQED